jgi:hypothetical protein
LRRDDTGREPDAEPNQARAASAAMPSVPAPATSATTDSGAGHDALLRHGNGWQCERDRQDRGNDD